MQPTKGVHLILPDQGLSAAFLLLHPRDGRVCFVIPWLGKTLFAPGTWTLLYRDQKLAGFPVAEVSPVKAVASRAFPVLLICDEQDVALPCRHSEMIYAAARGPKQLWVVPRAFHTAALGFQPEEFRRRVLSFFAEYSSAAPG